MGMLSTVSYAEITLAIALYAVLYTAGLVIYRLFFSPIARFPGPFLAKTSFWYEFYYDWVKTGQYYQRIAEMHKKYGPIVRVTPNELHISDPSYYKELFVTSSVRRTDGYMRFAQGTGFEDMAAVSERHEMHRIVRVPLDPFFSKAGILRAENRVLERVEKLFGRLKAVSDTGKVVNISNALASLANDIVSSVLFEEPSDYLGDPKFNETWFDQLKKGTVTIPLLTHLPWIARALATPAIRALAERATNWRVWDYRLRSQLLSTRLRPASEAKTRDNVTVFDHLVHSELVESHFGNGGFARLAQLMQQAGSHNVAHTTASIIAYLGMDKAKEQALRDALAPVFDRETSGNAVLWYELEKVPYLQACIQEGLRIAIGAMLRAPRISPDTDLQFREWTIPKGTPVSMSSYWMHMDPEVFPNPDEFQPERWLCKDPERLKMMRHYCVPFSKGSRACLGQNLVRMQMSHVLARLYGSGGPRVQLYQTAKDDVVAIHALLYPWQRLDSLGVQATIHDDMSKNI